MLKPIFSLLVVATVAACADPVLDGQSEGEGEAAEGEGEGEGEPGEGEGEPGEGEGEGEGEPGEGEGEGEPGEGEGEGEPGEGEGEGEPGGEGEGEGEPGAGSDVVINEVFCRDPEGVEIINRGTDSVDLTRVQLGDNASDLEPALSGTLAPGARRTVTLTSRIDCGRDSAALAVDGVVVDSAPRRLLPADTTIGRFPDGAGNYSVLEPTRDAANVAWIDESARLFDDLDDAVPATPPVVAITITSAAEASLRANPDVKVDASITFTDSAGTVAARPARIRLKGQSSSRSLDQKAAFKVDFGSTTGGNLFGVEHLTLNNMVQDNSASRERLFYGLLTHVGLPAPRVGTVQVTVNGANFGYYLALEAHDEEGFLGRHFSSSAHVYEGEYGQDLFLGQLNNFDEDYGDDPTRAALTNVLTVLENASAANFMADTAAVIDWERELPNMAADMVCSHWDSYTATKNNFYLHLDDDGLMSVLSSGADQAFSPPRFDRVELLGLEETTSRLLTRCLADTECGTRYDLEVIAFGDALDAWLNEGGEARLRADAATLTSLYSADPRRPWDHRQIAPLVENLIGVLRARVALTRG